VAALTFTKRIAADRHDRGLPDFLNEVDAERAFYDCKRNLPKHKWVNASNLCGF
jgi:hypothetical protein